MNKLFYTIVVSFALGFSSFADSDTCNSWKCDSSEWNVERGWSAVGDVLIVRPLGAGATVGGFGIFAVASPFAAMADSTEEVFNTLVKAPADYTFDRELGVWSK
jgi:hypothetical protein